MKKQFILVIAVLAIALIACGFIALVNKKGNQPGNNMNQMQNVNLSSLSAGEYVSITAEGSDGTYTAFMILACDNEEDCQNDRQQRSNGGEQTPPSGNSAPSGEAPSGQTPSGSGQQPQGNIQNMTRLSGTISSVNSDSLVVSLDTGETVTVSVSDSTRIMKK